MYLILNSSVKTENVLVASVYDLRISPCFIFVRLHAPIGETSGDEWQEKSERDRKKNLKKRT